MRISPIFLPDLTSYNFRLKNSVSRSLLGGSFKEVASRRSLPGVTSKRLLPGGCFQEVTVRKLLPGGPFQEVAFGRLLLGGCFEEVFMRSLNCPPSNLLVRDSTEEI